MTETSLRQEKSPEVHSRPRIKLVALNARYTHSCLALFYIRNELADHLPEVEVEILQLTINDNSYVITSYSIHYTKLYESYIYLDWSFSRLTIICRLFLTLW